MENRYRKMDRRGNSIHIQKQRRCWRMQELQTNMHNANNIRNLFRTHRKKLTKITHILTSNNQYGYKEGVSKSDAVINVEQYIKQAENKAKILLMDLSKAFDAINRTLLWTTLYKKGLPEETINHIRRGHTGTRLAPKYKGRYGKLNGNNIGVFQGSEISALLFIIYLDDMMEGLEALNRRTNLPIRSIQDRQHRQKEALIREETQENKKNMKK